MEKNFPQYLGQPLTILWIDLDVFVMGLVMFFLGTVFKGVFWLFAITIPLAYWWFQRGKPRGYLQHLYYAIGITDLKGYPTYMERDYHE